MAFFDAKLISSRIYPGAFCAGSTKKAHKFVCSQGVKRLLFNTGSGKIIYDSLCEFCNDYIFDKGEHIEWK